MENANSKSLPSEAEAYAMWGKSPLSQDASPANKENAAIPSGTGWGRAQARSADQTLAMLNDAIFPAALSASSYANRSWALDVGSGLLDPMAWADDANLGEDKNGLARAMLIAKNCKPLSAHQLGIDPAASGATMTGGVWNRGDLASALACVRTKEDGTREMHLSIRGTEFQNNPNPKLAAFQAIVGYLGWTFPSIDKHAKNFTQLAEAMRDYAADPANKISKIVLSGHSLGAAAAEKLVPLMQNPSVPVEMFGFGSPGHGDGLRAPVIALGRAVAKAAELARGGLALGVEKAADIAGWVSRMGGPSVGPLPSFSDLAKMSANKLAFAAYELEGGAKAKSSSGPAPKIYQFRNPEDLVPKMGALLYATEGQIHSTLNPKEFIRPTGEKEHGEIVEVKGLRAHSSDRYARAVVAMARLAKLDSVKAHGGSSRPELSDGIRDVARAMVDAARLSAGVPAADLPKTIEQARAANVKALTARDADDPTIARIVSMPVPNIAAKLEAARAIRRAEAQSLSKRELGEIPADLAQLAVRNKKSSIM